MAQAGFTPISLYFSSTAAAVPTSGNLVNGELALNTADMKLYAKNSSGVVTLLASNSGATGTVSSVAVSGGSTGLTTSGGPITTSGTITLAGTLAITNGGTGQTTATAAFDALAPSQTSNSGKYLTTNGSTTSWATVDALPNQAGNAGKYLTTNGTIASWAVLSIPSSTYTRTSFTATAGQTTFSATYTVGYVEVFLNGVLLNDTDYTASNGTTVVLAVAAGAGDIVETIAYNISNIGVASSASNLLGGAASQLVYQSGVNSTAFLANGSAGQYLQSNGSSAPSWSTPAVGVTAIDLFYYANL